MNIRGLLFLLMGCFLFSPTIVLYSQTSFINYAKFSGKQGELFSKAEDSLKKQFEEKKLQFPPQQIYLRSFKYDRQLEVWVKEDAKAAFKLFKS